MERITIRFPLLQFFPDLCQRTMSETGPRLTHMKEALFIVIQTQHNRAEVLPRSFRLCIPPDHAIHGASDFDLLPVPAAAFFITAAPPFGEYSFEAFVTSNLKQRLTLIKMARVAHRSLRYYDLLQRILAFFAGNFSPVVAVEINKIEGVIEGPEFRLGTDAMGVLAYAGPLLHQAER